MKTFEERLLAQPKFQLLQQLRGALMEKDHLYRQASELMGRAVEVSERIAELDAQYADTYAPVEVIRDMNQAELSKAFLTLLLELNPQLRDTELYRECEPALKELMA